MRAGALRRSLVIAATAIAVAVIGLPFVALAGGLFRLFYIPSESMTPTLLKNDRLIASMWGSAEPRRGDIILFAAHDGTYIMRVAALAGDRVEMRDGVLILDGRAVAQRLVRVEPYPYPNPALPGPARRLEERFPGEPGPHQIFDHGPTPVDDTAEQKVAPGHVFVLGDNRDHSADSRVPRALFGVEQVPISDIRGRALYYTWGPSNRFGDRINR